MGQEPFIIYNSDIIRDLVKQHATMLRQVNNTLTLSIYFDATKVPLELQICTIHKYILGGVHPNHFIITKVFSKEEVVDKINPTSDIEMAHEVIIYALIFQYVPAGEIPYYLLCGQPQSINKSKDFNREVTDAREELCKE